MIKNNVYNVKNHVYYVKLNINVYHVLMVIIKIIQVV